MDGRHAWDAGRFRERVRGRDLVLGSWLQIGHPASAELMAQTGFEWLAVDLEHTEIDLERFTSIARAIENGGSIPLARVRENNVLAIRQVLDLGAAGVIVPMVDDADSAERCVRAAKYPPRGVRGFGFARANQYGAQFDAYAAGANERSLVITQVESRSAVDNIDAILGVEDLDGVLIGPYDLSASLGIVGKTEDARVKDACRMVLDACQRHSKAAGIHIVLPTPSAISNAVSDGYTFIALGVDAVFLREGAALGLSQVGRDVVHPAP